MRIALYQINVGRDENRVAFLNHDNLNKFQGTEEIDSGIYDKVFDGEVPCENLEEVFSLFNNDFPDDYSGRSMSVSDIVEVKDETGRSVFSFCDSIGFVKVNFDPNLANDKDAEKETIRVVLCEPGKEARIADIEHTLEKLQEVVGGYIEAFYPFEDSVCICNEESKLTAMPPCRAVYDKNNQLLDIIHGTFFICDCSGEDFASLDPERLERYKKMFFSPETFIKVNGRTLIIHEEPIGTD